MNLRAGWKLEVKLSINEFYMDARGIPNATIDVAEKVLEDGTSVNLEQTNLNYAGKWCWSRRAAMN